MSTLGTFHKVRMPIRPSGIGIVTLKNVPSVVMKVPGDPFPVLLEPWVEEVRRGGHGGCSRRSNERVQHQLCSSAVIDVRLVINDSFHVCVVS